MIRVSEHYRRKYGCKVYKLALSGGFTCPNRDGTLGFGGCTFCSRAGSGDFTMPGDIPSQLEKARQLVARKNPDGKYIAYFQSFTSTYAPVEKLERLYRQAIEDPDVVELAIGTRPDCLGPEVMELLKTIAREKPVTVELGLQTIHEDTARAFHRGYETPVYFDAVKHLKEAKIEVVTHIILGLPKETVSMAVQTTQAAVKAGTDGLKFSLLHILKDTAMAADYEKGLFDVLSLEEYGQWLKACIDVLPPDMVVHRITGDGAKKDLIAPLWSGDKKRVLNYLNKLLQE